jgi:hypothetical protein
MRYVNRDSRTDHCERTSAKKEVADVHAPVPARRYLTSAKEYDWRNPA